MIIAVERKGRKNMSRLIDADALKESMMTCTFGEVMKYCYPCVEVIKAIKNAPTIETERKTGHWITVTDKPWWKGGGHWTCSSCGYGFAFEAYQDADDWNYCPNCGAKMEGDES